MDPRHDGYRSRAVHPPVRVRVVLMFRPVAIITIVVIGLFVGALWIFVEVMT